MKEGPYAYYSGWIVSERFGLYEIGIGRLRVTCWAYETEITVLATRYGDDS